MLGPHLDSKKNRADGPCERNKRDGIAARELSPLLPRDFRVPQEPKEALADGLEAAFFYVAER